ncbi:MAG TPA: CusA/CzcA family heavy metal efflux RND transporter [Bryobacteraceae bacterium]|jgi:Cu(I)/Ag(I) efflux system membrane protein CusA/SilA
MIERIIEISAKKRGAVIALVLAFAMWGWWSLRRIPLDALPDLSDTQIILYSRWDRSPDLIESQVTYPLVTAMLGAPRVKAVRGISDFGSSFVYVVFEDGTDLYWARSRAQEYLAGVLSNFPPGVKTELGPDANGLGWVYEYALQDDSGRLSPADLRNTQDSLLRYHLRSVPGVAEVASLGGFVAQYQVTVDPARLRIFGLSISQVADAVRRGNTETDGRVLEFGGSEYVIRGRGYLEDVRDFEEIALPAQDGAIVKLKDVGHVALGPEMRRGIANLDGKGDAVCGVVVMRSGANALDVIQGVKRKLDQVRPSLPAGVRIVPVYDRSELIHRVIRNLRSTLVEIILTVVLVILLFLWHLPSAIIPVLTIPLTLLAMAGLYRATGLSLNALSLGGIAIAAGALVDAAIVVVEQTYKKLEEWRDAGCHGDPVSVILLAIKEVARPAYYALLIMTVAFLPVLALEGQEGRLFRPLVFAKSLTMLVAAVLTITLDPALRIWMARFCYRKQHPAESSALGKMFREERHVITRLLTRGYHPVLMRALRNRSVVAGAVLLAAAITAPLCRRIGSEFMPPLDEGVLFYMPSTVPGISITEARRLLQLTGSRIRSLPEVAQVLGKAGRADTATDAAPLSMLETLVVLKPRDQWPERSTWYSRWAPDWLKPALRHITSDRPPVQEVIQKLDAALPLPGVANSWTMPIRGRIDMLATGLRSPLGLKISGRNPQEIQQTGVQVEDLLRSVPGTRSVFAERMDDGLYIDVRWDRGKLSSAGIGLEEAQAAVENAIGGDNVTTVIHGRARYPVNVRLPRDLRGNLDDLRDALVSPREGRNAVTLGQVATVGISRGPAMIRDENGLLTGYVYIDLTGRDSRDYVGEASSMLRQHLQLPPECAWTWSGEYESIDRTSARLWQIVPLSLAGVALLLYWSTRSIAKAALVFLAVPFSAIGAIWSLYLLSYPMSPAVWVGFIALFGVDAETGTFMLLYLDLAYQKKLASGRPLTSADLREATLAGAVRRIRPKFMTVLAMFAGLLPILWSDGAGAEVMKRIAAPMIGGLATSFLMELLVYPVLYEWWMSRSILASAFEPVASPVVALRG